MKKILVKIYRQKIILGLAFLSLVTVFQSCTEDFLDEDPPNLLVAENLFTDRAGFEAALNGLYHEVRKERMGSSGANETNAGDIRFALMINGTDNVFGLNPGNNAIRMINELGERNNPENGYNRRIFNWLYRTINGVNTIIGRSEDPSIQWTEEDKNEVLAEARTIRAWAYRHLVYLWGDVPLSLEESRGATIRTDWERAPVSDIYDVMEADLLFAEEHLPVEPANPGKVSKAVAQHYLAELYLLMGRPAEAESKAMAVINGPFSLITERYGITANGPGVPFMDQFYDGNVLRSQGNTEVLWAILQENAVDNPEQGRNIMRRYFIGFYRLIPGIELSVDRGGRGIGRMAPTNWALGIYEPEDDRGGWYAVTRGYIYTESNGDVPQDGASFGDTVFTVITPEVNINNNNRRFYPHSRKWEWADVNSPGSNEQYGDQPYLRLADTYLLLAEAQLAQGNTGEAAESINVVRRRSNASEIGAGEVTIDFLLDERSREFLCEEQRRYCLLRNNKLLERTRAHNPVTGPVITERDRYFPIPQSVIDANLTREMRQNDGY